MNQQNNANFFNQPAGFDMNAMNMNNMMNNPLFYINMQLQQTVQTLTMNNKAQLDQISVLVNKVTKLQHLVLKEQSLNLMTCPYCDQHFKICLNTISISQEQKQVDINSINTPSVNQASVNTPMTANVNPNLKKGVAAVNMSLTPITEQRQINPDKRRRVDEDLTVEKDNQDIDDRTRTGFTQVGVFKLDDNSMPKLDDIHEKLPVYISTSKIVAVPYKAFGQVFDFVPIPRWNDAKQIDYLIVSNSAFQWYPDEQALKTYISKCKLHDDYLTLMIDKKTGGSGSCCYRKCLTSRGIIKICIAMKKDNPNDAELHKNIHNILSLVKKFVYTTRTLNAQELQELNKNKPNTISRPSQKRQTMSAVPLSTEYRNMTDEELDENIFKSLETIIEESESEVEGNTKRVNTESNINTEVQGNTEEVNQ